MTGIPSWQAQHNGPTSDLSAADASGALNQFLGAHTSQELYSGSRIITPLGGAQHTWLPMTDATDYAQPITMSGTVIGRVQLPLLPTGNGADVLVQLWPDNGFGAPNISGNPLAATFVPAAYLNNIAASNGLDNAPTALSTEQDNEYAFQSGVQVFPFLTPAGDSSGSIQNPVVCTTSDSMLFLGGFNATGGTILATCASTTASGGVVSPPIPQPPLPQATSVGGATVVSNGTVVYCGGSITGTAAVTNVWAASWDSGAHTIGSWSAQTALPAAVQHPSVTSWNSTIYVVGGADVSNNPVSSVYSATVTNNQVGSWRTSQPLPAALTGVMTVTVAGWLFAIGGTATYGSSTGTTGVYYAQINSDGSLGPWLTGPSLPNPEQGAASGWSICATTNAIFQISGHFPSLSYAAAEVLTVTESGPAPAWYSVNWFNEAGDIAFLPVALGNGQWTLFALVPEVAQYWLSTITPMPYVSIPLTATGLTNGSTYHILMRTVNATSASDGVSVALLDGQPLPGSALQSSRYASGWTVIQATHSVPLTVWDASASSNNLVRHMSQDPVNGLVQSWSSLFYGQQKLLAGVTETTLHPSVPLNANPTFTSGVTPWTAVNGTITQSNAQTHGGFPFSGLLTPTGGFTQAYAISELIPVTQTQYGSAKWLLATGYFYTPTTWSSFDLSVFWFDSGGNFISSSDLTASLTGTVWTQESHYVTPPATAAGAKILAIMNGSPAAANTLYMSNVQLLVTPENVGALASIAEVDYPTGTFWPPIGVTQLN